MIPDFLVTIATLLTFVANLPQIYKIIKTKSSKDLSVHTFITWTFITFIFSVHAIEINDIYFIASSVGMFVVNIIILYLTFKYR